MTAGADIRRDAFAALALFLIPLLLLARALDPAHGLAGGDWNDLVMPLYEFARGALHDGSGRGLPLWNPHLFCGMPFLESLNTHALYPTELAGLLLGVPAATFFAADAALHLGWAGLGVHVLGRQAGRGPAAAFTGGLCYQLGHHLFGLLAVGIPWIRDLAWLPWLFVGLEGLRRGGGPRPALLAGVALGLPLLTAGFQYAAFAAPFAALWIVTADPRRAPARLAAVFGTATAVGAVLWLPALEYAALSVRRFPELIPVPLAGQWALTPREFVTFLSPLALGGPDDYRGPHPFFPSPNYFGLLPPALATAGALAAGRRDLRFLAAGAAGLLLAFGPATPLGALVARLPVYGDMRGAQRWLMLTHLAVAWFATCGWEWAGAWVAKRLRGRWWTALTILGWAVIAIDLGGSAFRYLRFGPPPPPNAVDRALHASAPDSRPGERIHADGPLALPNRHMRGGEWTFGYHGIPLGRSVMLKLLATTPPPFGQPAVMRLLNVGRVVDEAGTIRALPPPDPRAFLAAEAVLCADTRDALAVLRAPGWTRARAAIEPARRIPPAGSFSTGGSVSLQRGRDDLTADVRATGRALVVFSEIWYPAWKAFVDGARVPVWRADVGLRAVEVPAGAHRIRMIYDSRRLKVGLWITLAALLALPGLAAAARQ